MLITICIPVYNSAEYLEKALYSIINQSYKNLEIIISDNASTDNSWELIKKFQKDDSRIKISKNFKNIGYSANCNKMIKAATGRLIAIYHSDDIYHKDIVKESFEILNSNKELSGIFTLYRKIDNEDNIGLKAYYPLKKEGEVSRVSLDEYIDSILITGGSPFCCPTSMIRKEVYQKLNGYDENLKFIEDQDMWARILLTGELAIINKSLIYYRIHESQGSNIYKEKTVSDSLPLKHIQAFIKKNSLNGYEQKIRSAKSKEAIFKSYNYVKKGKYKRFLIEMKISKSTLRQPLTNHFGWLQLMPPNLVYLVFYLSHKIRYKSLKQVLPLLSIGHNGIILIGSSLNYLK